jgi:UDP-N-acetylglucosamine--N-acetylmuramyl-(pentapeptide) pyrophosphoryl-undecaprenol N-acetylglucosamine transferase
VVRRVKPDVVVGLGGYITFPGGMMGVLLGKPLVLHEQNSVAGMANKVLARRGRRVFSAFPQVLKKARWIGNPLRAGFLRSLIRRTALRRPHRSAQGARGGRQPGRQGAQRHRAQGAGPIPRPSARTCCTRAAPSRSTSCAPTTPGRRRRRRELTPFIDDTAQAYADADLVICRAGASTVTEIAAVGAAGGVRAVPLRGGRPPDHQREGSSSTRAAAGWCSSATSLRPPGPMLQAP